MISVLDLIREIDFEPEVIFLHDNKKTIEVNYASLREEFGYDLDSFLELVPVDGKVYFINRVYKNETDLCLDTHLLELLKQIYEEQNDLYDQKLSKYLLMVQNALDDLRSGDANGITELTSLIESNVE